MRNITLKRWLGLVGLFVLVSVLLFGLSTDVTLAQGPPQSSGSGWGPGGMMGGWGRGGMMGGWGRGGMMGGWGYNLTVTPTVTGTTPYGYGQGGWGPGGCPGMGGWGYARPGTGTRLGLDQAAQAVEQYLAATGNPDLALVEVMEFSGNFYAEVKEKSTDIHAFELLVDPYTGAIYPEPGPNMMWNTKYGHMGGWGGYGAQPTTDMPVSPKQAREDAQRYLDAYLPGTTVADEADPFYGYYTLHVLRDGKVVGMLSVNGAAGQVWYHTWHGEFVGMKDYSG